jgi:hypothetical protein
MTHSELLIHIYNSGYLAGHHDTVEGCFIDVYVQDMETEHADIVDELVQELSDPHPPGAVKEME